MRNCCTKYSGPVFSFFEDRYKKVTTRTGYDTAYQVSTHNLNNNNKVYVSTKFDDH